MTLNDEAILALTTPPPPATDFVLVLRPVADPVERGGHPARTPEYRLRGALKVLLRGFGLKCVSVAPSATNAPRGEVFPRAADRPPDAA